MLNNRIDSTEIIKIADAVADEKSIDKNLVLNSMETAIEKAARTRYGSENEIYVKIDRETGKITYGKVPAYSVVVPGSIPNKKSPDGPYLYCAVIVKKVDEKTRSKTSINELLRD